MAVRAARVAWIPTMIDIVLATATGTRSIPVLRALLRVVCTMVGSSAALRDRMLSGSSHGGDAHDAAVTAIDGGGGDADELDPDEQLAAEADEDDKDINSQNSMGVLGRLFRACVVEEALGPDVLGLLWQFDRVAQLEEDAVRRQAVARELRRQRREVARKAARSRAKRFKRGQGAAKGKGAMRAAVPRRVALPKDEEGADDTTPAAQVTVRRPQFMGTAASMLPFLLRQYRRAATAAARLANTRRRASADAGSQQPVPVSRAVASLRQVLEVVVRAGLDSSGHKTATRWHWAHILSGVGDFASLLASATVAVAGKVVRFGNMVDRRETGALVGRCGEVAGGGACAA